VTNKTLRLNALLGAKSEPEQIEVVKNLAQPTMIVTIAMRPFDGYVQVHAMTDHGGPVPTSVIYYMLDAARGITLREERNIALRPSQAGQGALPGQEKGLGDPPSAETPTSTVLVGSNGKSDETSHQAGA
jgi:hypothetical protein